MSCFGGYNRRNRRDISPMNKILCQGSNKAIGDFFFSVVPLAHYKSLNPDCIIDVALQIEHDDIGDVTKLEESLKLAEKKTCSIQSAQEKVLKKNR
jgi:hypothetical protein